MNILMINKFLYPNGGSETYMFNLGKVLEDNGHHVQYFGMEHENRIVGNRVESYTTNMNFHGKSKLSKLTYPFKTIYSKEARIKIRAVLDDFQPDICHLNNFNYQLTPSIILEIRKWEKETNHKVKIVHTAHDYQLICPNHMMNNPITHQNCEKCIKGDFKHCAKDKCIHSSTARSIIGTLEATYWKHKNVYSQIDTVICCSEFIKTKLDQNPIFQNKTVCLHNFIDATNTNTFTKKDYVIYFGRYAYEKGVGTLIEACKKTPHIQYIFAGSGPLEDTLKGIDNIKNVGFQTGEDLVRLVSEAKFSIYPSEWYENCPLSVMESQIYGTPVLGANIGGIPELIEDEKTGKLFESKNLDDLIEKINYMYNDEIAMNLSNHCKDVKFDNAQEYYQKLINL